MTFAPTASMPSQVRCERVPPAHAHTHTHTHADAHTHEDAQTHADAHATCWDALDLRMLQEDNLPLDPRVWSRGDVGRWVSLGGGQPARFPMNGKALCLMTRDMFAAREPARAPRLHRDFRRRLARALALQELLDKMAAN